MSRCVIGIDPGADGAIVEIDADNPDQTPIAHCLKGRSILGIAEWLHGDDICLVVLERVQAMKGGGKGDGAKSAFSFGRNIGHLEAILELQRCPYITVRPQEWKNQVLAGHPWRKDKRASIDYVHHRFPKLSLLRTDKCTVDHTGIADATCLALYGLKEIV